MAPIGTLLALGSLVAPALSYKYDVPSNCTHGPESRGCWKDGFDIYSDYTNNSVIPPGKLVEYNITLSQQIISPDGYEKIGMVVNGQYPGPIIEADWGDTLRITVYNNFTENFNGTSIHWHGIRQYQTNWLDGVPGVTQCPSKPGEAQVYEFRAMQYGTSWYHGHFSLQYSNGLYGALIIHGPSSANFDYDLGPWFLTDWYHDDVFSLDWIGLVTHRAAIPETTVLNGKGVYDCNPSNDTRCTGDASYYETTVKKNKKYKIGIINSSTLLTYQFWIDGHNLTIIGTDFVSIEPYIVDVINVGIGQRYEFIIETNADLTNGTNFWIHAQYCNEVDILPNKVGILRYDPDDKSDPYTPPLGEQHRDFGCADPDPNNLIPVVKQSVGERINGIDPKDYLLLGEQGWPDPENPPLHKWIIKDVPMWLDWSDPTLKKLTLDDDPTFPPETVPVYLDFETDTWVYFIITANYSLEGITPVRELTPSVHPIHLHGHDFNILAQGKGVFPPDVVPNLENPARRDTIDIDIGGWAWIAFQINNPGAWLLHCHLAFHASDGLALQFIEQPNKIEGLVGGAGILPEFADRCDAWTHWYNTVNIPNNATQADSGI